MTGYFRFTVSILVACLATFLVSVGCLGQAPKGEKYQHVNYETYEYLLDQAFSHQVPEPYQTKYSIDLRFMSSNHTESEVFIYVYGDGSARATLFTVQGTSVWNLSNAYIEKNGNADIKEIAKLIKTSKQEFRLPPQLASHWYSELLDNIAQSSAQLQHELQQQEKTGEVNIFFDGSTYELHFRQGTTQINWKVMDEEVNDTRIVGNSPVARWMNTVRQYAITQTRK